jgi:long-subunit acyl-CoA synthetase (AMP-forming)
VATVADLVADAGVPDSESFPPDSGSGVIDDAFSTTAHHHAVSPPDLTVGSHEIDGAASTTAQHGVPLQGSPARSSADIAVVLFTSGSTGRPKGVELPHRAVVSMVWWMSRAFGLQGPLVCCAHHA